MRECACNRPVPSPNPRRSGVCARCGSCIAARWSSSDETIQAFYGRLSETQFPYDKATGELRTSDAFDNFLVQCRARELAGREKFGFSYLTRSNAVEAMEEAADLANYAFFDTLQAVRDGRGDEDYDAALIVAYHAFKAHEAAQNLRHKRAGEP